MSASTNFHVTRGGRRVYVEVEGDPKSQPTILAVHGGPGFSHDYFKPGLSRLREQGFALVYVDLPGGGRSPRVAGDGANFTPYLDDLEAVREAVGARRLTVLGHAFGAVLAVEYARAHPVDGLILVSPLRIFRLEGQDSEAQARRVEAVDPSLFPFYLENLGPKVMRAHAGETALWDEVGRDAWWPKMFDTQLAGPPNADWTRVTRAIPYWGIETYFDFKGAAFSDAAHPLNHYDLAERAKELTVPVLVTVSDNDGNYVAMGRTHAQPVAEAIAGSTIVRLDDLGHFPFAEAPDAFAAALAPFLAAVRAPQGV